MNERIEELANEAAAIVGVAGSRADFAQKFAELIVRECARIQHERFCQEGDVSWGLLMRHFGIKE